MVIKRLILTILPRLNPHHPPAIPPIGTIPESIGKLAGLQVLGLSYTGISGTIVKTNIPNYGFPRQHDHRLRYDSNPRATRAHFTGSIPPEIGALVALKSLDLSYTDVEGASRGLIQIS